MEEEKCGYRDINGPPSEGLQFQAMGRILTDNLSTFLTCLLSQFSYVANIHHKQSSKSVTEAPGIGSKQPNGRNTRWRKNKRVFATGRIDGCN